MSSPSEGLYPLGGFSNFLQSNPYVNHPNGNENFHLVGVGMISQSSVSPIDQGATRTPSPAQETHEQGDDLDVQEDQTINVDDDSRTAKRLLWNVPDDIRLASAWLRCSKDPIDGNDKKSDAYWADVTSEYNKTAESSRKRNRNQLKIRWDRSKKPLTDFHGVWVNATRVWQSGMSDDQLTDKALEMWAGQNDGKAFHLQHMWKVLRGQQKWSAYLARLKKEHEKSAKANGAHLVNLDLDGEKRPVGHKKAKKEQNGKKKSSDALADFSGKFEKFIEATTKSKEDLEKMAEIQQSLADKKIEAARLNSEATHEQTKGKMLETYTQLLLAPTDQLTEDAKAERKLALESLRLALFPKV
ncbi:glutathione S-transferase T3 [Sorghum bicolor]|nr:glutathione S-transferase T3 [Sorghum bicolor]|eukprot:XP_002439252.2 glutathione S-transferase T3 [Sorghum bicolor]